MIDFPLSYLFNIDTLAVVMMLLVGIVGVTVASFSTRYLKGDSLYRRFFILLGCLIASVFVMVSANHLLLLLLSWGAGNLILVRLMIHKSGWTAARASGRLAARNFAFGFLSIAAAFGVLYAATGETSIRTIVTLPLNPVLTASVSLLLFLGVMTQSALWPFHRWLTSSLNSPTPVSAIMHAGLVNGGGFLLARFSPLFLQNSTVMTAVFVVGFVTAVLGTIWKLMQNDIKRMLACSTMGQMGFMVVQCGLGLFPAAVAHLCWHGLFKAYLFLSSGAAAQEKRLDLGYPPRLPMFSLALVCGAAGAWCFSLLSNKSLLAGDTTLVLIAVAFIGSAQFSMPILRDQPVRRLPIALSATAFMGGVYGLSVHVFDLLLGPVNLLHPQPLNAFHVAGIVMLVTAWVVVLFVRHSGFAQHAPDWAVRLYVKMLNASQPHPATVTTHRNQYQF